MCCGTDGGCISVTEYRPSIERGGHWIAYETLVTVLEVSSVVAHESEDGWKFLKKSNLYEKQVATIEIKNMTLMRPNNIHFFLTDALESLPEISLIKSISAQIRLKKTNPIIRVISTNLYAVEEPMFSNMELEKANWPVNAKIIEAKMPKIVMVDCIMKLDT